ncbi:MAG TPA: protein YgfX [Gammaproteobacteria bacterium]
MSNSSAKSVTPLVLEPGASLRVRLVTLAGALPALFAVAVVPLPLPLRIVALLLFVAAFVFGWRQHHALSGKPVTVRLDSAGNWQWQEQEFAENVELLGDSYHLPFLVILNFIPQGKRRPLRTLLLTIDNIDVETLRRLRVHLKWQEDKSTKA